MALIVCKACDGTGRVEAPTKPFATCYCGNILIATFERPKKEWHCLSCGRWLEWLQARDVPWSQERQTEHDYLLTRFKAGERGGTT